MTAGSGDAAGIRVALSIPQRDWYELALEPGGRDAAIAGQWDALRAAEPELDRPEVAEAFAQTLRTLAAHYARRGSQIAAVEWHASSGRPPETVLDVKLIEPLEAESPRDEAEGLSGLLLLPADDDLSPRAVDLVELPAGPAARLRLLAPGGRDGSGRDVVCDIVQYWLPCAVAPATVVVTCSTADLVDADRIAETADLLMTGLSVAPAPVSAG